MAAPMGSPARFLASRNTFWRSLIFALLLLSIILITVRPSYDHVSRIQQSLPSLKMNSHIELDCGANSTHLKELKEKYDLDDKIQYAKRYIRYTRRPIERASMTKINQELFPDPFDTIDITNPPLHGSCEPPLEVPVTNSAYPETVDASPLLFGISTTYKRLTDPQISPMKEWSHWLTDGKGKSNGAGLVLLLIGASDSELEKAEKMLRSLGIDAKVSHIDEDMPMAERYLTIIPTLYNSASRIDRKWLIACDDDTFFPSLHALLAKLATYDHNQDLYIGTLSEDVNNIARHGSQAFGGAGVFFSVPLAAKVTALYPQCRTEEKIKEADSGWGPQGDILLRKCIYEHTEVRLTMLRELHQLDLYGDPSGFYESGLHMYSLHHYKGGMWHRAHPYEYAQIQHACGQDCLLQRFQTTDDFIISTGFSIAYYPRGIDFDVHQIERTFVAAPSDKGWNMDFMLGPQRQSLLNTGRKISWDLKESTRMEEGEGGGRGVVRQTYVRKKGDERWSVNGKLMVDVDGVIELVWIP